MEEKPKLKRLLVYRAQVDENHERLVCSNKGCRRELAKIVPDEGYSREEIVWIEGKKPRFCHYEFPPGWAPDMNGTWHLTKHSEERNDLGFGQNVRRQFQTIFIDDELFDRLDKPNSKTSPWLRRLVMWDVDIPLGTSFARCPNSTCNRRQLVTLHPKNEIHGPDDDYQDSDYTDYEEVE